MVSADLTFRPVTSSDVPLLIQWDAEDHVASAAGDPIFNSFDWEDEIQKNPPWREMYMAETHDGKSIGYIQLIDCREEETHYWGDGPEGEWGIDLWIGDSTFIGQGYGRQMITFGLQRCFGHQSAQTVLVDPLANNTKAHRFYEAMGFSHFGPRQFGPDQCQIYAMTKTTWQTRKHVHA